MNKTLEISAMQYDFHTLLKVSDICGLTGEIGFHDTDTGYLVSFPDDDGKADQRMAEYKKRLVDLCLLPSAPHGRHSVLSPLNGYTHAVDARSSTRS